MSHVMRKPVHAICEQHPRSLISAFVVRCLDSIIHLLAIAEISKTLTSPCNRFESQLVANPEDRFSRDEAQIHSFDK